MLSSSLHMARLRIPDCRSLISRSIPSIVKASSSQFSTGMRSTDFQRKVAHILVPEDKEQILDECLKRYNEGTSFQELASNFSTCKSASRGGDLGWLSCGSSSPEIEDAVFGSNVGSVVRVKSSRGRHLIKILDERELRQVQQMDVTTLAEKLSNPLLLEDVQLVDVREHGEYSTAHLPHFKLFPLSTFSEWSSTIEEQLDPNKETIVMCHHGMRSMQLAQWLVNERKFKEVFNVVGGIHAYSTGVDRSVPVY